MRRFTELFCELDQTTRINDKVAALERYFRDVPPSDAAWALWFLSGHIPARVIPTRNLWIWAAEAANLRDWLMEECYAAVGDLGETLALIVPNEGSGTALSLADIVTQRLLPLRHQPEMSRRTMLLQTWAELNSSERLVWNKLITGEFRIGVSRALVIRALANLAEIDPAVMSHRVLGQWQPTAEDFEKLLRKEDLAGETARPYPFFLASPMEIKMKPGETLADALGDPSGWIAEWKWDGIRAQLIHRGGETCIWSRGDEMVTDSFPEIANAGDSLPGGTVLDGEIVAWKNGAVLPFAVLQRRLGRKRIAEKMLNTNPVAFVAYDLLECDGVDWRQKPLSERRNRLESLLAQAVAQNTAVKSPALQVQRTFDFEPTPHKRPEFPLQLSPVLRFEQWSQLEELRNDARVRNVEGVMLKRISSAYGTGRQRGDWWKWKINPFVIDAVLIYAQPGHGRRASLYTDYTFGVWRGSELVPVAKAYSGLTDEEIHRVDAFIRGNTVEKHGPLRRVKPELVFELAFEGVQKSTRHKSGIAVRFPRMNRWRRDKKPAEADTLETLEAMMPDRSGET